MPLILHWDGRIIDDFTGPSPGNELPILVSGQATTKVLSVQKLVDGTVETMVAEVMNTVDNWGLCDRIKGLCCDTTALNTGTKGGVCVFLNSRLVHDLLNLACHHHVAELVLQVVFNLNDVSKSSDIEIFVCFRYYWPKLTKLHSSYFLEELHQKAYASAIQVQFTEYDGCAELYTGLKCGFPERYGCIFTCLEVRAIPNKVAHSLKVDFCTINFSSVIVTSTRYGLTIVQTSLRNGYFAELWSSGKNVYMLCGSPRFDSLFV